VAAVLAEMEEALVVAVAPFRIAFRVLGII
jgi:hypothetical protein